VLLVGSFCQGPAAGFRRLRHATRYGCKLSVVHAVDDDLLMPVAHRAIVRPDDWVRTLAGLRGDCGRAGTRRSK
jgi:NADH-quinone oxidoreductase subunit G